MITKGVERYSEWSIINEWRECLKRRTVCEKRIIREMMALVSTIRMYGFYYNIQN